MLNSLIQVAAQMWQMKWAVSLKGSRELEEGSVHIFAIQMGHLWPWMSREPVSGL